jgi:hypothetical protein
MLRARYAAATRQVGIVTHEGLPKQDEATAEARDWTLSMASYDSILAAVSSIAVLPGPAGRGSTAEPDQAQASARAGKVSSHVCAYRCR